jgi:hypothetical protein
MISVRRRTSGGSLRFLKRKERNRRCRSLELNDVDRGAASYVLEPEAAPQRVWRLSADRHATPPCRWRADPVHQQQDVLNLAITRGHGRDAGRRPTAAALRCRPAGPANRTQTVTVFRQTDPAFRKENVEHGLRGHFTTTEKQGHGPRPCRSRAPSSEIYGGRIWAENRVGGRRRFFAFHPALWRRCVRPRCDGCPPNEAKFAAADPIPHRNLVSDCPEFECASASVRSYDRGRIVSKAVRSRSSSLRCDVDEGRGGWLFSDRQTGHAAAVLATHRATGWI